VSSYESKLNGFWNDASAEYTLRLISDLSWKHLDIILDRKSVPTIYPEARRSRGGRRSSIRNLQPSSERYRRIDNNPLVHTPNGNPHCFHCKDQSRIRKSSVYDCRSSLRCHMRSHMRRAIHCWQPPNGSTYCSFETKISRKTGPALKFKVCGKPKCLCTKCYYHKVEFHFSRVDSNSAQAKTGEIRWSIPSVLHWVCHSSSAILGLTFPELANPREFLHP
jgi:hypothetical protein